MENSTSPKLGFFRRGVIAAIGLAALAAVLAGVWYLFFSGANSVQKTMRTDIAKTASAEEHVINMQGHWKGEDLREDFIRETVKEFETRNPHDEVNIKWNVDFPDGRKGALEAIVNQFRTGKIDWDIIWLEPFYYQEIGAALDDMDWAKKHLVDFEGVPGFKESQKPFVLSDPQYRNHMNGVITGPYIEGFYQPLFYNKELADKMGIKVKESGMTEGDLLGYFEQVAAYNASHGTDFAALFDSGDYKGGIGYAPSVFNIFQSLFRSEFASLAEVGDLERSEAKMAAVRKALGSLEKLSAHKPLIAGWKDLDWFGTRQYVLEDKAVFTACGASWMYSHWHGLDPQKTMKMVPVEMPAYQPVNHYMGGYNPMFAVAKDSPVRDEAVKLLMAFSTPNVAEKWVRYAKGPSGIKGNISSPGTVSQASDQFDRFISSITAKYGGNVFDSKTVDYILGAQYRDLTLKFSMHLADVMDGKATAAEAYQAILSDMKSIDNR
jgi:ABC-type glycerol-3-phosphate transport system substrate-binding protein